MNFVPSWDAASVILPKAVHPAATERRPSLCRRSTNSSPHLSRTCLSFSSPHAPRECRLSIASSTKAATCASAQTIGAVVTTARREAVRPMMRTGSLISWTRSGTTENMHFGRRCDRTENLISIFIATLQRLSVNTGKHCLDQVYSLWNQVKTVSQSRAVHANVSVPRPNMYSTPQFHVCVIYCNCPTTTSQRECQLPLCSRISHAALLLGRDNKMQNWRIPRLPHFSSKCRRPQIHKPFGTKPSTSPNVSRMRKPRTRKPRCRSDISSERRAGGVGVFRRFSGGFLTGRSTAP